MNVFCMSSSSSWRLLSDMVYCMREEASSMLMTLMGCCDSGFEYARLDDKSIG